jgi:Uma2 family endonuclease
LFTYPDVSVVCGALDVHPQDAATIRNPRVLFEVLSPSTEAYDRGAKFGHYRSLPSLQTYVLVLPAEPRIEIYERTDLQKWTLHDVIGEDSQVFLPAIGVSFELRELYTDLPDA